MLSCKNSLRYRPDSYLCTYVHPVYGDLRRVGPDFPASRRPWKGAAVAIYIFAVANDDGLRDVQAMRFNPKFDRSNQAYDTMPVPPDAGFPPRLAAG